MRIKQIENILQKVFKKGIGFGIGVSINYTV